MVGGGGEGEGSLKKLYYERVPRFIVTTCCF